MPRLPQPGQDGGVWGDILNEYLLESHTATGDLKPDTIGSSQLQQNAVTSSALAPNSVTAVTIADGTITENQLSSTVQTKLDASTTGVADGSIGTTQLANGAVTTAKLATAVQTNITAGATAVQSVNGRTGTSISLVKSDVGLSDVDNTSDAAKPISNAVQTALNLKVATTTLAPVATSGKYTDLTSLPTLSPVATSGSYTDLANKPTIPVVPVSSVAGRTGDVVLTSTDVGLGNVNNTSDLGKPISTATQTALNLKATSSSLSAVATSGNYADLSGRPTLSTVATSGSYTDLANKPIIPTIPVTSVAGRTGDVVLTSADVGLGNVSNTADADKPVSTATQTALNLKANVADLGTTVLLVSSAAALPAGTPAGVIVVVQS